MLIDLKGKTAVVTGSTRGIGFAIAKGLALSGARIVINGRGQNAVDAALTELKKAAPKAGLQGVAADLGTAAGCDTLVKAVSATDILVNNLGIFNPQDVLEIPDAEWQRFFDVNVMSGVRLSRAYLPQMIRRNWGRVIFISSESGLNVPVEMIHYGFTKTAQISIARGLAKRAAGTGVTVNSVLPGPTLSEGVVDFLDKMASGGSSTEETAVAFVKKHRPSSIIQRAASVEEVANMVIYIASPQASATTGAALRVDGGVVDTLA